MTCSPTTPTRWCNCSAAWPAPRNCSTCGCRHCNALFPDYRTSLLDALGSTMHDHGIWATGDVYPRYTCDYGTPAAAAVIGRLSRTVHVHLLPRR